MDFSAHNRLIAGTPLESLAAFTTQAYFDSLNHGDLAAWQERIASLPPLAARHNNIADTVQIGDASELTAQQQSVVQDVLKHFIPWRKGPFSLFGTPVDTEWRSEWKWQRLLPHISPLAGRKVLDVGCGNGYHCFRMFGEGARLVTGLDPHLPYVMQFLLLHHFVRDWPIAVLPIGLEKLPLPLPVYDSAFSMGVLYHRRSPFDHLLELKGCLRSGGELVLETLVVDGGNGYALTPEKRYCRMSNVWFIPSVATVEHWLQRCGFVNVRTVDVNTTTTGEQRSTDWMPFQSLSDGLDPDNPSITIEGLPAPKRAIVIAEKP